MRRPRTPELLVLAGLVLLLAVAVLALFRGGGREAAPPPAPTTTAPPPPPPGLLATEPSVTPSTPSSAVLRFRTSVPAKASVAYGIDGLPPTLWLGEGAAATDHALELDGTVLTRQYRIELQVAGGGQRASRTLLLAPHALESAPHASVANGAIVLDGRPFFPLMSWAQCADQITKTLGMGINLFLADPCGGVAEQVATLQGRALAAGLGDDTGSGAGVIGFAHPDEPDGLGLNARTLPKPEAAGEGRISFLTFTNHFFSGAAPLPQGRGIYPALAAKADVLGFDLYPLQEWCRPERITDVEAAQRELVTLARGKPTFQWIEAATMKCHAAKDAVTPEVLRTETLLALIGGAHGIGFFPPEWDGNLDGTVTQLTRAIDAVSPALLQPAARASATGGVHVGARTYRGAVYVLAVNPTRTPVTTRIAVHGLDARTLTVLDESRTVRASGGAFTEQLPPLGARLYVAPPSWAND